MISREKMLDGQKRWAAYYDALDRIGEGDGSKEAAVEMLRMLHPNVGWQETELWLLTSQKNGELAGLNIVDNHVVEPIKPVLTEKGIQKRAEMADASFLKGDNE